MVSLTKSNCPKKFLFFYIILHIKWVDYYSNPIHQSIVFLCIFHFNYTLVVSDSLMESSVSSASCSISCSVITVTNSSTSRPKSSRNCYKAKEKINQFNKSYFQPKALKYENQLGVTSRYLYQSVVLNSTSCYCKHEIILIENLIIFINTVYLKTIDKKCVNKEI